MNDPHVEYLTYRLTTAETLEFEDPPSLEIETEKLALRLEQAMLTVWPKEHFASVKDARKVVYPYLESWEAYETIRRSGRREVGFEYKASRVVDRDPPPPPPPGARVAARGLSEGSSTMRATPSVRYRETKYPQPPEDFILSSDVRVMLDRYEGYREGKEPLLSMAYFCLSWLEFNSRHEKPCRDKHRQKAARRYGVNIKVLDKLGELTSNLGDEGGARKVDESSKNRPPTAAEKRWIEECVLVLTRRVGEHATNPEQILPKITMAELHDLQ